jgi:microcompartment protein CcmK/EutM
MLLARVTGTVVASEKSPGLEGIKFLVVQPLDKRHQQLESGVKIVAVQDRAM